MFELGGHPMILRAEEMQLTRGESMGDVARVLSRHAAVIGLRTGSDEALRRAGRARRPCPSINMLSPSHHPCQALADLLTLREALGDLRGRRLAYVGDGANNVARSLAIVGARAGLEVAIAAPGAYQLEDGLGARAVLRAGRRGRGRGRGLRRRLGVHVRRRGDGRRAPPRARALPARRRAARPRRRTAPSRCTACPPIPARRSPPRCSTATASASGTRPRTAATRRRRCSNCS